MIHILVTCVSMYASFPSPVHCESKEFSTPVACTEALDKAKGRNIYKFCYKKEKE